MQRSQRARPETARAFRSPWICLLILPFLTLLPSCAGTNTRGLLDKAEQSLLVLNYRDAYRYITLAIKNDPDSVSIRRLWKNTRILLLLDLAKEAVFEDNEERALRIIAQVLVLAPDNRIALTWQKKARTQLGKRRVADGEESLASGQLDDALARFREASTLIPGDRAALVGMRQVAVSFGEKRENAEFHYDQALRAKGEGDWRRVLYHSGVAYSEDPSRKDAKRLYDSGRRQVADLARFEGELFAEQGDWAAAARRFQEAAMYAKELGLPWEKDAETRSEAMAAEREAILELQRAELLIAAKDFEQARTYLAKAQKHSMFSAGPLNEAALLLRHEENQYFLERAALYEIDHRFERAHSLYEQLEKRGVPEAREKKAQIELFLKGLEKNYSDAAAAMKAGETKKAVDIWMSILAVHRNYRDVEELLRKAQAKPAKAVKPAKTTDRG